MNKQSILNQLKEQFNNPKLSSGFDTQHDCIKWVTNVTPLFKFSNDIYNKIKEYSAILNIKGLSRDTYATALNQIIRIGKETIFELGNKTEAPKNKEKSSLQYPDKVTLKWLWEHIPARYVWSFILALIFVFMLGIKFTNTNLYKSLTERATAIIKQNKTTEPTIE